MFFQKPYKKYQKELNTIYSSKYMLDAKYEELVKKTQCRACPKYIAGKLPAYAEHFPDCGSCEKYPAVLEMINQLDDIPVKAAALMEGDYAKAVFDTFAAKAPTLVNISSGEACAWKDIFGSDFGALSAELRRDLAGLIEGTGHYRMK